MRSPVHRPGTQSHHHTDQAWQRGSVFAGDAEAGGSEVPGHPWLREDGGVGCQGCGDTKEDQGKETSPLSHGRSIPDSPKAASPRPGRTSGRGALLRVGLSATRTRTHLLRGRHSLLSRLHGGGGGLSQPGRERRVPRTDPGAVGCWGAPRVTPEPDALRSAQLSRGARQDAGTRVSSLVGEHSDAVGPAPPPPG